MKNFEKYIDEIFKDIEIDLEHGNKTILCTLNDIWNHYRDCTGKMNCEECMYKSKQWLLEEYVEPIQLTHAEYVILKNVDNTYKFICRNACSKNLLLAYGKSEEDLRWCFSEFNHLFTFIKGNEIYEIAKLIEDYEKEHQDEQ